MRTRILAVDHGAARSPAREPYRLLARRGFDVLLLAPELWKEAYGEIPFEAEPALKGLAVRPCPLWFNGRYHRALFKGLGQAVKEFQPDHLWIQAEPENWLAAQALRARDRHCPGARLTLVSWRNIDFPRNGLPYRFPRLYQRLEDSSREGGARLLCYNREAVDIMGRRGFPAQPWRMGVSLEHFKPGSRAAARKTLGLASGPRMAGFAGRFIEEKGVGGLIQAMSGLKGWELLLVGDGPAREAWMAQAAAAGLKAHWRPLQHGQMALAFQAMDLLVLPSRSTPVWKEQFGRVLVEAMACGTPCLGSDSGAIPEVIGKAGWVFPEGDIKALRKILVSARPASRRAASLRQAKAYAWTSLAPALAAAFPAPQSRLNSVPVQGLAAYGKSREEALVDFKGLLRGRGGVVFYLNAHTCNLAAADPLFRGLLRKADLLLPDGAGVLLSGLLNGNPLRQRLALGDLVAPLARLAASLKKKVFLWGGEEGLAEAAAARLGIPEKAVAGCAHGFHSGAGLGAVIKKIRASKAGLAFLGMGSPRQEELALRLRQALPGLCVVACGNAFSFIAGRQSRAPQWMQAAGLEWSWRLAQEPGRLGGRYILGNARFALRALWERLGGRP